MPPRHDLLFQGKVAKAIASLLRGLLGAVLFIPIVIETIRIRSAFKPERHQRTEDS